MPGRYEQPCLIPAEGIVSNTRTMSCVQGTGALKPEEVLELSHYCHDRFIELVPNQQSFGHMQHWLKKTAYKHLAEDPSGTTKYVTAAQCWPTSFMSHLCDQAF